jgi:ABC-type sugar transport system permease subunit/ABC-type glycerol-3-phosphate transport system substrate-binding protein
MLIGKLELRRRGYLPLWMAVVLAVIAIIALTVWTISAMSNETSDGRETIVFWGGDHLGEEVYAVINQFEHLPENLDPKTGKPKYKVIIGTATSPDITSDAQRLLCAVAGEVPPDVVWFDRFAIGEWAARGALEDLSPYLKAQNPKDPNRINLDEYYKWAIQETSYRPPGSNQEPGIYGIPWEVDMRLLYCNSNLLRQEGLVDPVTKQPRAPRTWEELRDDAQRMTRYRRPGDPSSGLVRLGFAPNFGETAWLYMYSWMAGGAFMNDARTKITMDSPQNIRALRYIVDSYDALGGYPSVYGFQQSFQSASLDPFLRGDVAMKLVTTYDLEYIADWQRDMDFIVAPPPLPADRVAAGAQPITWGGGYSFVIPSTARNKAGAWKLIQYVMSKPVVRELEQGRREQKQSEGKLYLPRTLANRVLFEELLHDYVDTNPKIPPRIQDAYKVVKAMFPRTLYRPVTPVGQLLFKQQKTALENGVLHAFRDEARKEAPPGSDVKDYEMHLVLASAQQPAQQLLDEILTPLPPKTTVKWTPWFAVYAVLVAIPFVGIFIAFRLRRREYSYKGRELAAGLMFASPWMIGFIFFVGGPILFSLLFCFTRYSVLSPAHWVGLENFKQVVHDRLFYKALGNTAFMIIRIPLTMAASLAIAMLLNNAIRGRAFYRTACYMPAITPIVASSLLWVWILNPSQGSLNEAIRWFLETRPMEWFQTLIHHHFTAPLWLQDEHLAKPSLIIMSLWSAGGGMIIWLAGLGSIPQQLYEAAAIDGAGPWRRFWNVTIPMLSPYILFNFIVGVIGTMQIFNEAFVMTQGGPADATLFYAYHLFREAFQFFRMGYASALAWILFLIVLALTMLQLWLSTKWVHYERA